MYVPVSVVIPCYCCEDTIERSVVSVMNQTGLPIEVILVDDASPDQGRTLSKLRELQQRFRDKTLIKIIALEHNGGPSIARNAGWEAATQPYIAFLDADDAWHSQKLEIQCGWMKEHPEVALSGHKCVWVKESEGEPKTDVPIHAKGCDVIYVTTRSLLCSNRFSTRSVMLKKGLPFRFEPQKRYSEDYYLWLQIVLSGHKCVVLDIPLAYFYKSPYGEGGLSADLWAMEKGELDTYYRLYKSGYITFPSLLLLSLYSFIKFCRRFMIVYLKKAERALLQ